MEVTSGIGEYADEQEQISESILMAAHRRLAATGYPALRTVCCEYCQGTVVLHGRVATYYLKQLAQAVLLANPLGEAVVNQIEVVDTPRNSP